jgi:hypothetical protein
MLKRNTFILAVLLSAVCAAALGAGLPQPSIREIKQPTFSQPAFVRPGESIPVVLDSAAAGTADSAVLTEPFAADKARIYPAGLGVSIQPGSNELSVATPADIPAGLYDLCVYFTAGGAQSQDCQAHAVAVVASFDPPFTFAHFSDYHMGDPRAERQFPGVDIRKVRLAALAAINSRKPSFAILTGDVNAYPDTYEQDYPASARELVEHSTVPLIILPGNHDFYAKSDMDGKITVDGEKFWGPWFGPKHRVLDFGPVRFIFFNSYDWPVDPRNINDEYHLKEGTSHTYGGTLSGSEYKWVFEALKTKGDRIPILASHHGPRQMEVFPQQWCADCVPQTKFMGLIHKAKVPWYLYGHIHVNSDATERGARFIATTSVGSDADPGELWCVRFVTVNADRTITTEVVKLFDAPPMKQ